MTPPRGSVVAMSAAESATRAPSGTAGAPGWTQLTLLDIRDINGTHVPDGARVALSAADMATTDPRGGVIHSAGGTITGGTPAANNANFQIFTISNGSVVATYTMSPVTPPAIFGTTAVVQVIAADSSGTLLGHEAVATIDLNLRAPADRATVAAAPSSLYADKVDRRSHMTIQVRDAGGNVVPDGTRVGLTATPNTALGPDAAYIVTAGGTIIGGTASGSGGGVKVFTVTNGVVSCDYSSQNVYAPPGQMKTAVVSVLLVNASNMVTSWSSLGTAAITLAGPASAEVQLAADSVALVAPPRDLTFSIHHVHDVRAGLVPDGASFGVTANSNTGLVNGAYVGSAGGVIQSGAPSSSGSGVKVFQLSLGQIVSSYNTGTLTGVPGVVQTANLQMVMVDPATTGVLDWTVVNATPVRLVPATNAVGTAQPPSVLADSGLHTSTVTFNPVLDAFGNVIPDGT